MLRLEDTNSGTRVMVTIPCSSLVFPEATVTPIFKDSLPNKAAKSVLLAPTTPVATPELMRPTLA